MTARASSPHNMTAIDDLTTDVELSPLQSAAAIRLVCGNAQDAADALHLLAVLGLLPVARCP